MWDGGRKEERGCADTAEGPRPNFGTHQHALPISTAACKISIRKGPLGIQFGAKFLPGKVLPQGRNITAFTRTKLPLVAAGKLRLFNNLSL